MHYEAILKDIVKTYPDNFERKVFQNKDLLKYINSVVDRDCYLKKKIFLILDNLLSPNEKRLEIQKIINSSKADGIVSAVKAREILWDEVLDFAKNYVNKTEALYQYINQYYPSPCKCGSGKIPAFVSFTEGYRLFCNSNCKAACAYRSKTIELNNSLLGLANPQAKEQQKLTLQAKFGEDITNVGQLPEHRQDMRDNNPVHMVGVSNQIEITLLKRLGVKNPAQKHINKNFLSLIDNVSKFEKEFKTLGVVGLSNKYNVKYTYVRNQCIRAGFLKKKIMSLGQYELNKFIKSLGFTTEYDGKTRLSPKQIDIFIPEKTIAIEYNGLFHHSNLNTKNKKFDPKDSKNKLIECNNKGYRLLTIFEDEWLDKTDIVKSMIRHILGVSNLEKIYARKCSIKKVPFEEANEFYDKYHILGSNKSITTFGLYYNDKLVAAIGFKLSAKKCLTQKYNKPIDIIRYCSSAQIPGGFSKLLKFIEQYCKNKYNSNCVVTTADLRFSEGNLYKQNGFTCYAHKGIDYFYVKNGCRYGKRNFRKEKLKKFGLDIIKKEKQLVVDQLKYQKVWDCGKDDYLKTF